MAAATAFVGAWTGDRRSRLNAIAMVGLLAAGLSFIWLLLQGGDGVANAVAFLQSLQAVATAYALWRLV